MKQPLSGYTDYEDDYPDRVVLLKKQWRSNKMNEEYKPVEVKVKIQEIEYPKLDLTQYIGKKERIADYTVMQGKYGFFVRVHSTVVDEIKRGKEVIELKASRIFGLGVDAEGKVGWGKDSELGLFLILKKAKDLDGLKGKEVLVQLSEKEGKNFLTFI